MTRRLRTCCLALLAGALLTSALLTSVRVLAVDRAASTDELMKLISSASAGESQEHRQREAEFIKSRQNQKNLLAEAQVAQRNEEARSARLEQLYNRNDQKIEAVQLQLDERLGSLKELFGHLAAAAGDVRANFDQSIVTAQYPGRSQFVEELLVKMSSDTRLPKMEEIEQLWVEMSREMVESGKVVRFPATVVKADGEQVKGDVVRVGVFNLMSDGAYLDYNPQTQLIGELARQPDSHTSGAAALQGATEGFTATGIDPTGPAGGNLLKALIDTPTLMERFHQGGLVGYIITAIGVLGALLAGWRFVVLHSVGTRVNAQLQDPGTPNGNNPLGRVLQVGLANRSLDPETLEMKLNEVVLKETPAIEAGLSIIKIIAAVGPLLGLLGTVTGMIVTFQQLTIFGAGDPKAMAGGISQALVTTVQGLVVAIPMVLLHTVLNSRAGRILHVLEEQSAGIIAESIEG